MGQPSRTEHIRCIDANGRGLYVRCVWTVDRYQHQIGWLIDGVEHAALESCEGTPDDVWPPSPPIQQFSMQMIDGNPALLGVGMAGRGHWSASFVLRQKKFVELVVELACFLPQILAGQTVSPHIPGSTYRFHEHCCMDNVVASGSQQSIALQKKGLPDLVVHSIPGSSHFGFSGTDERPLVFEPIQIDVNKTIQWSYRISVAG